MATGSLVEIMSASSAGADRIRVNVPIGRSTEVAPEPTALEPGAHKGSLTIEIGVPLALLREVEKRVKEGEQVVILGGTI